MLFQMLNKIRIKVNDHENGCNSNEKADVQNEAEKYSKGSEKIYYLLIY